MQQLLGEPGRVSRILVHAAPGKAAQVAAGMRRIAAGKLNVGRRRTGHHPARRGAPTRRAGQRAVRDHRRAARVPARVQRDPADRARAPSGDRRPAAVRHTAQRDRPARPASRRCASGLAASAVGIGVGELLSRSVFQQSTGYLAAAFALSGATVTPPGVIALAALGGVRGHVPCLERAAARPAPRTSRGPRLSGTREGRQHARARRTGGCSRAPRSRCSRWPACSTRAFPPRRSRRASRWRSRRCWRCRSCSRPCSPGAHALSERRGTLSTLAVALGGVRATTVRSLALAATGAVALFGSVALGGARSDLLAGIHSFAHDYAADAPVWVSEPGDNQATGRLQEPGLARRIARLPGVASVSELQGSFLTVGQRRVWVIARPPGGARRVLAGQTLGGAAASAARASRASPTAARSSSPNRSRANCTRTSAGR